MKKKIFIGIAMSLFAVATVFNMNISEQSEAGDVSLDAIAVMAQARDTEGPMYRDYDGGSFWDTIWDNTFNRDWKPVTYDIRNKYGRLVGQGIRCDNGNNDSCDEGTFPRNL
jgi:hypothetical protein